MSLSVLLENIMLVILVISVIFSFVLKYELARNAFICLLFYAGLAVQYYLKEHGLGAWWFVSFGSLFLVGMIGVLFLKWKSISKADCCIIFIFFLGILRNLIMHFDRYLLKDNSFLEIYRVSSLVFDALVIFMIFWPLVTRSASNIKKMERYGVFRIFSFMWGSISRIPSLFHRSKTVK
ncbi:hypothetical protein [Aliikangiella coralliicola]|uniref:Uncharacterized protein n=1 Tax=Aliikangiella coralliicola TaxID=2592383 RepID=A0A545U039_9GAMM|nr:hypothetical protein [Aliikangiella coralliicola]TQV82827.1 hypothetical protein FLL46_23960 [Aliikangiella coralliicola]